MTPPAAAATSLDMPIATIIGLDTPAGAYLARLLRARNYAVTGTATDPDVAAAMLAELGADEVRLTPEPVRADEAYLLDHSVTAEAVTGERVFVALAPGADAGHVAALRGDGRFVAGGVVHDHVSRLDPDHWAMAICTAVRDGRPLDLPADDHPRDLGWTPEYVDAMWRLLQANTAGDSHIASGSGLTHRDAAQHAAEFFKRDIDLPAAAAPAAHIPSPIPSIGGWRAYTDGRELIRTLCEALPAA